MIKILTLTQSKVWLGRRFIFALSTLLALLLGSSREAFAMRDIDSLSGADQRFTVENSQEVFSENFHQKELLAGTAIVDEATKQPLGSWKFYRQIKAGVLHDDNYSATYRDPKPETIYTYTPTVGMSHRSEYTYMKMFYNLSYSDYVQNQKLSRFNQDQYTSLRFKFNRLTVSFENTFKPDSAFVQGEKTELHTTDGKHVITYFNTAQLKTEYKFSPKTDLSFLYSNDVFYFPKTNITATDNSSQSTMTHKFIPKIAYRLTPKTSVFVDYKYTVVNYFKGGDFGSHENAADIGVEGRIFSGLGVNLSMGYNYLDYLDVHSPALKGLTFQFGVSKKILPKVQATLSATREVGQDLGSSGFESSQFDKDFYGLNLTWKASSHITVDAEGSVGYTSHDGMITLPDLDNPRLTFTRPREDQIYKWGIKLLWNPKPFFDLLLAYEYVNQNSSFKDFEYYAHRLAGYLSYKF